MIFVQNVQWLDILIHWENVNFAHHLILFVIGAQLKISVLHVQAINIILKLSPHLQLVAYSALRLMMGVHTVKDMHRVIYSFNVWDVRMIIIICRSSFVIFVVYLIVSAVVVIRIKNVFSVCRRNILLMSIKYVCLVLHHYNFVKSVKISKSVWNASLLILWTPLSNAKNAQNILNIVYNVHNKTNVNPAKKITS